jgi:serine/threonine protein kinase
MNTIIPDVADLLPPQLYDTPVLAARGGLGSLYRARHIPTGTMVAIKVVPILGDDGRKRAERELGILRTLKPHQNLLRMFDCWLTVEPPSIVQTFEWIHGGSLSELLSRRGALPSREVAALGRQLSRGLAVLHEQRLAHRDVKPSNILVSESGLVKVGDFGLLKLVGTYEGEEPTRTWQLVGTPAYMSPESIVSPQQSTAGDIYSLGVLLLHALNGQLPATAKTVEEYFKLARANEPSIAIPESLSNAWRQLIAQLIAPDPARRPTAANLIGQLNTIHPGSSEDDINVMHDWMRSAGSSDAARQYRPPEPLLGDSAFSGTMFSMVQDLRAQIAQTDAVIADLTMLLSRDRLRPSGNDASLSERIEVGFELIRKRAQSAWTIGLVMTIVLFVLSVGLILTGISLALLDRHVVVTALFGTAGIVTFISVVAWKPFDRMFAASAILQQMEMIQLNYRRAFGEGKEERDRAFGQAIAQLDNLLGRLFSDEHGSRKRGQAAIKRPRSR